MSALGNLPGYQVGIRAAQLLGYRFKTRPLTDPPCHSATGSSHVRVIASRPDPARPIQTEPDRGAISFLTEKISNSKQPLSVGAEVVRVSAYAWAREARMTLEWCWACREYIGIDSEFCPLCVAPPWMGLVLREPCEGAGVYVLAADCGFWKIGMSSKDVAERTTTIIGKARRAGATVGVIGCLPGADVRVERWLHRQLRDSCDRSWAVAERLPEPDRVVLAHSGTSRPPGERERRRLAGARVLGATRSPSPSSPPLRRPMTPNTKQQYAIVEASKLGEADPYTERPLTDPAAWELRDLHRRCAKANTELTRMGEQVAKLRDVPAHALSQAQFEKVRDWEKGRWTGDAPDKDKRYVVVAREITAWAEVDA